MISLAGSIDDLQHVVAELFVVRASGHASDSQRNYPLWELSNKELKRLLEEGVGGVILYGGTATELQHRCKTILNWAAKPLLLCADIEEGLGQRFDGGTWLVPPIALGQIFSIEPEKAIKLAEKYGSCIGDQARRCGLNWVLAPVCDVNSDPLNPVINVRAWGEDPETVSTLIQAFQRGLELQGVLSCAKHFPGHGDTRVDSHLQLPRLDHDLNRLKEIEFIPFQAAISARVSSVMTGHLLLKKLDSQYPATLSETLITQLLRQELDFDGLVVTDALVMEAISKTYGSAEAAVLAFAAGADLILMPEKPEEAIKALCSALLEGRIPKQRLEESIHRRRNALAKVKESFLVLHDKDFLTSGIELESSEDRAFAYELVSNSLQTVNAGSVKAIRQGVNLLRVDDVFSSSILTNNSPAICLPEQYGYKTILCHPRGVSPWQEDQQFPLALDRLGEVPILLQLFIRGNPFRGSSHLKEPWVAAIEQLQSKNLLAGLVVYGSPYLWAELLKVLEASIPAGYSPGQMPESQTQTLSSLFSPLDGPSDLQKSRLQEFT